MHDGWMVEFWKLVVAKRKSRLQRNNPQPPWIVD